MLTCRFAHKQEFAEERKHVVKQHAAQTQELSDIIAAVEVQTLQGSSTDIRGGSLNCAGHDRKIGASSTDI